MVRIHLTNSLTTSAVENSNEITGSSIPNLLERTDLDIYYQKVSRGFATIPDTSGDPATDQIQARVEENRIVGPISDEFRVLQITRNGNTATAITVDEFETLKTTGFLSVLTLTFLVSLDLLETSRSWMHNSTTDLSQ